MLRFLNRWLMFPRLVATRRAAAPFALLPAIVGALVPAAAALLLSQAARANPAGPVVTFGGRHFTVTRGSEAFESIAFDPVNKYIASRGTIRNRCGAAVSNGPDESPGLAWDSVTNSYWQITNDRIVRRWVGDQVVQTVFTIPQIFNVPGTGADTLDAVKGIAVDANYVYVVDAGPNSGQISSNEWFKFTRAGVPVKSSKSTALQSFLHMNPDCLFDDILYLPASSPVYPGRFLIPLEHSGLIVVDSEGYYVDALYWVSDPLYGLIAPFAFTGMAVDPTAGTFYLAENDGASSQVWTMIPAPSPVSYIVGAGGGQAYLQWRTPGCNLPLWKDFPPPNQTEPGLIFGLAYRPADQQVYGYDFNSGQLWKFSPLQGEATLVDATGPQNVWGLAYDSQRDVLYASEEIGFNNRIQVINPTNGNAAALPNLVGFYLNDIAFNPSDNRIYGVSSTAQLIRIDRDTGIGTVVGPTQSVRGLDYDPATGGLIGINNSPARLYGINPANGNSNLWGTLPNDWGWEGLAVVTLPAVVTEVAQATPRIGSWGISVSPNPAANSVQLRLDMSRAAAGDISAFDSAGRLVRHIYSGSLEAGARSWVWDGRDAAGRVVPAGLYWIRVHAAGETEGAKVVWIPK